MNLPSHYQLTDRVQVKLDSHTTPIDGEVIGVTFTEAKVYYDILTEYELLTRIDSALVATGGFLGTTLS